ncbi:MAG: 30S ribosomal protein S20 [Chlamydiales bacterium]|nr:30S ribosomal protein S20 [Chlamydiales bacterium]
MADEKKKKTKRPTAAKRDIRNEKKRMINKSFKSKVRSAMNAFHESVKNGEKEEVTQRLATVYSLMDKGVKRGIYKVNKAGRLKSNAMKKVQA